MFLFHNIICISYNISKKFRTNKLNQHYPFSNLPLPYAFDALEPFIDAQTMELHHDRHLQTYIDNLNNVLKNYPEYQNLTLEELLTSINSLPEEIRMPVKNNAGGVFNHFFFFDNLQPVSESSLNNAGTIMPSIVNNVNVPSESLMRLINSSFDNFENFKSEFTAAALSVFGSGYAWLVLNPFYNLQIITTANQDTPLMMNLCPVLSIDVWEHAYYLKNYNMRAEYINNWFNVVNWEQTDRNLMMCMSVF